jgi:hypothetical protein
MPGARVPASALGDAGLADVMFRPAVAEAGIVRGARRV